MSKVGLVEAVGSLLDGDEARWSGIGADPAAVPPELVADVAEGIERVYGSSWSGSVLRRALVEAARQRGERQADRAEALRRQEARQAEQLLGQGSGILVLGRRYGLEVDLAERLLTDLAAGRLGEVALARAAFEGLEAAIREAETRAAVERARTVLGQGRKCDTPRATLSQFPPVRTVAPALAQAALDRLRSAPGPALPASGPRWRRAAAEGLRAAWERDRAQAIAGLQQALGNGLVPESLLEAAESLLPCDASAPSGESDAG